MEIESYKDGVLIKTDIVEGLISPPNFTKFNIDMLTSESYINLLSIVDNKLIQSRLELFAVRLELKGSDVTFQDLAVFESTWNNFISNSPISEQLVEKAFLEFNQIAFDSQMPFKFETDLKMIIS